MPILAELYASRATTTGANPAATLMYSGHGTISEPDMRAAFLAAIPPYYEIPTLQLRSTRIRHMGNGHWECEAQYGFNENRTNINPGITTTDGGGGGGGGGGEGGGQSGEGNQPGANDPIGPHIRISIGAERQHVTQSLSTQQVGKRVSDTDDPPNFAGAIGVSDGGVAGCDIIVPKTTWTETWTFKNTYITWAYIDRLDSLVGRVNYRPFRNRAQGEVMFLGAEIDPAGTEGTKIVYSFHREINLEGFRLIADGPNKFTPVRKRGHEFAWVLYEQKKSPDDRFMLTVPKAIYIEAVGRDSEFGLERESRNMRDFSAIDTGLGIGS